MEENRMEHKVIDGQTDKVSRKADIKWYKKREIKKQIIIKKNTKPSTTYINMYTLYIL